jgi:hypothetical protein
MDLPSVSNAPRALSIGGATYRARALTLGQLGELLAWLEDRINGGARPVPLASDSARLALATTDGLAVLLHLSLLSCQPTLTRDRAAALVGDLDAEGEARLLAIAFRRRPGYVPPDAGVGKDLAESDWGAIWEGVSGHRADRYEAVGQLTLDQLENHVARGALEGSESLAPAEVQAMWEAARAAEAEAPAGDAQSAASSR